MIDVKKPGRELNRIRKSDGLEVVSGNAEVSFLRFANSTFHQHMHSDVAHVIVRSRYGKKTGTATTSSFDKDALIFTLRKSEEIAKVSPEDPHLPDLQKEMSLETISLSREIEELTPDRRASILSQLFERFPQYKFYGAFFTYKTWINAFHSTGFELFISYNDAQLNILALSPENNNSVWVQRSIRKLDDIDMENIAHIIQTKLSFGEPSRLPAGEYTVIMEPLAFSNLISFMSHFAFSGEAHVDGYSPLKGKLGEKVFSENLTIIDDPEDETLFPLKYDGEGVEKKKLTLVERGVFKNIAYDRKSAKRAGTESTGHAFGPFGGVYLLHLVITEGEKTLNELIEETEKGILITRFHYVNVVDVQKLVFTGMTRDGTFLIENGKLVKSLTNMRFNVSLFDILSDENLIVGRGSEDIGQAELYSSRIPFRYRIPPVKIKKFRFIQS